MNDNVMLGMMILVLAISNWSGLMAVASAISELKKAIEDK